jgi:hypothetical protein
MFKVSKYTLISAVVIAAASAPSSAYAMIIDGGGGPASAPAPSASVKLTPYQQRQLAGHQQVAAKEFGNTQVVPAGPVAPTRSTAGQAGTNGFPWDDVGFGAAGMLGLLGAAGATSVLARRRREHHAPAI